MKTWMLFAFMWLAGLTAVASYKASAQGSGGALVVATCGTLPIAYSVGATRALTVNVNGQVCQ